jgi:hypothetical protein
MQASFPLNQFVCCCNHTVNLETVAYDHLSFSFVSKNTKVAPCFQLVADVSNNHHNKLLVQQLRPKRGGKLEPALLRKKNKEQILFVTQSQTVSNKSLHHE